MSEAESITEAIMFLNHKGVSKEMLFPEFESVLDSIIGLTDCKNQEMHAVFLKITAQLTVTSTVFFNIKFDDSGMADPDWNMPLRHLADTTTFVGPDLGAGPVRLVCRSQCSLQWLEDQLWDPEITDQCNHFAFIRDAAKRNRMGLIYVPAQTDIPAVELDKNDKKDKKTTAAAEVKTAVKDAQRSPEKTINDGQAQKQLDELEQKQKLYLATLENRYKRELEKIHSDHQADLQSYKNKLAQFEQLVKNERVKAEKAVAGLQEQLEQAYQQRVQLEENLNMSAQDKQKLEALKKQYEIDMQAKLEAERADLLEQLEMREVELLYRHQQEQQFKMMLDQIRQEKITLLGEGGDRYLERLNKSGVVFVAYQPGSGHLTIPLSQMGRYIDDPLSYVAEKNGLTIEHYKAWLAHYNNPLCVAKLQDGTRCTAAVKQVLSPKEFIEEEHNYCAVHRVSANVKPA